MPILSVGSLERVNIGRAARASALSVVLRLTLGVFAAIVPRSFLVVDKARLLAALAHEERFKLGSSIAKVGLRVGRRKWRLLGGSVAGGSAAHARLQARFSRDALGIAPETGIESTVVVFSRAFVAASSRLLALKFALHLSAEELQSSERKSPKAENGVFCADARVV